MKRFSIYLIALCLLVCLAAFQAPKAQAATHSHCVCGGDANGIGDHVCADSVTWQPWDGTTTLKDGGHYYLNDTDGDGKIILSSTLKIEKKTVSLCLNGVELTCADRTLQVNGKTESGKTYPATLNICDCKNTGSISSTSTGLAPVLHSYTNNRGRVTINLYGGHLIAKDNDDTVQESTSTGSKPQAAGVLRLGNTGSKDSSVYVGTFNMYGGTICQGMTSGEGGNVYISAHSVFNLYGGTVSDGKAGTTGGNFYVAGTLNLQGGLVTGGKAISYGSGIYIDTNGSLTVGGTARVEENLGSNVYLPSGKVITANGTGKAHVGVTNTDVVFAQASSIAAASDFFSDTQADLFPAYENGQVTFVTSAGFVDITAMSISPNAAGMGYKARFNIPENLWSRVVSYGYQIWREGYPVRTVNSKKPLADSVEFTLRIKNILASDNDFLTNWENADTKLYAKAFIRFQDGTVCYSAEQSHTLQEMLTEADKHYKTFTQAQKNALDTMFTQYRDLMLGWDIPYVMHSNGNWVDLNQENFAKSIDKSGQYRLIGNVDLADTTLTISAKSNVTLCLDGYTISGAQRLFKVYGTLTICDCHTDSREGTITSSYSGDYAPIAYMYQSATMNIYGGKLTASGKVAKYGGVIVVGNKDDYDCRLNMYGGTIFGGKASEGGGLLWVINTSTFNMYDGKLYDGTADSHGGAINMGGKSTVNLYGGEIYHCSAGSNGGGVYSATGNGNLYLGSKLIMEDNTANQGGNVYHGSSTALTIDSATITGGKANIAGGIYSNTAEIILSGDPVIRDNENGSLYLMAHNDLNTDDLGSDADVHIYNGSSCSLHTNTQGLTLERDGYKFASIGGQTVLIPESFTIPTDVEGFQVGFGRADITPTETGLPLAGYGNSSERLSTTTATNEYDELKVSCVAITDENGETVLLMSVDLIRPGEELMATIFPAVSAATGVPESHIFTTFTHTHSVPETKSTSDPGIQRYNAMLPDRFAESANQAMADRAPAAMETGSFEVGDYGRKMNFTRHYQYEKNGVVKYFGDNFGTSTIDSTTQHVTEADHTMHLVKFTREGKDILMANWRVHPHMTGGGNKTVVSADIIGTTRYYFEQDQDCHFIYLQGAAGNVNEKSKLKDEEYPSGFNYQTYGSELAGQIQSALSDNRLTDSEIGLWQVDNYSYTAISDIPTEEEYTHAKNAKNTYEAWLKENPEATSAQKRAKCEELGYLTWFHFNNVITRYNREETYQLPLNTFALGRSLAFYTAPGELWDTISMEMEEASPFDMTLCMGYSQDHNNYFVYDPTNGGAMTYESYESNNYRFVAPDTVKDFLAYWKDSLNEMYNNLNN
ncbi:MAG: hypothetical protein IKW10_04285 [Oscillospiraceae bacterium]|nr:hypothetical protein [Oscillospiraceae bacterium]